MNDDGPVAGGEPNAAESIPARKRVVIVGGGCAGVATAFWLTAPELDGRFDVTLYTHGWRLGGKGASGRAAQPPFEIEEHGLHLWMGCYANAFRMMRHCLAEYRPAMTIRDAFIPIDDLTLMEHDPEMGPEGWLPWPITMPAIDGDPDDNRPRSLGDLIVALADWLKQLIDTDLAKVGHLLGDYPKALRLLKQAAGSELHSDAREASRQIQQVNKNLSAFLETHTQSRLLALDDSNKLRRAAILANLGLAIGGGLAAEVLDNQSSVDTALASLNDRDLRKWLDGKASSFAINSAPVRALYDLAMAYADGNTDAGSFAAGVAIRAILDMGFGARGAFFWKMVSGMGDTVFEPLYKVLKARGVRIAFFHRLVDVVADDGDNDNDRTITALTFKEQAKLKEPANGYNPFVRVGGRDCWRNAPDWSQLEDGDVLQGSGIDFEDSYDTTGFDISLRLGEHFDCVVLAIPPESLRLAAPKLTHPRWMEMLDGSASIMTQAFQAWHSCSTSDLGWDQATPVTALAEPFATWADMTHLLSSEDWSAQPIVPRSLQYFCGPMRWPLMGAAAGPLVATAAEEWLADNARTIWPNGDAQSRSGRFIKCYKRANADPSELYVQVTEGSVAHRLPPAPGLYENLFLAGDWTLTRNSGGCVENAVESGLTAAHAISGNQTLGQD